jgi:hypothetical protein
MRFSGYTNLAGRISAVRDCVMKRCNSRFNESGNVIATYTKVHALSLVREGRESPPRLHRQKHARPRLHALSGRNAHCKTNFLKAGLRKLSCDRIIPLRRTGHAPLNRRGAYSRIFPDFLDSALPGTRISVDKFGCRKSAGKLILSSCRNLWI